MRTGDNVRIIKELNKFKIYQMGNHTVRVFYQRPNTDLMRILELPKCLVESVPDVYAPTMKEIRQRLIIHAQMKEKGWTFARIRGELKKEKGVGG